MGEWFAWETVAGSPLTATTQGREVMITPVSQRLVLRWPGGGFVWHFPRALLVTVGDQTPSDAERRSIPDPTRAAVLGMWFVVALVLALAGLVAIITLRRRGYGIWRRKS
jgi:hypothetical protein